MPVHRSVSKRVARVLPWVIAALLAPCLAWAQPRRGGCDELARGEGYVVVFREDEARFETPPRAAVEGEEVILCVDSPDRWNRYRLTFGRSQQGANTSVGFAPSGALTTALRRANESVDASLDCATLSEVGGDRATCAALQSDVAAVLRVQRRVSQHRDALAQLLVDLAARPLDEATIAALDSLPDAVCLDGLRANDDDALLRLPTRTASGYAPFPACGSRAAIEAAVNELLPETIHWNDGQWHFLAPPSASSAASVAPARTWSAAQVAEALRGAEESRMRLEGVAQERGRLLAVLAESMRGYSQLSVIAQQIVTDARRRDLVFRLGRFGANTLIAATLERYGTGIAFASSREGLTYSSPSTTYALSIRVSGTSYFQAQLGVAVSLAQSSTVSLQPVTGMPGVSRVVESRDAYYAPAVFVSILWCAQDLSVWYYGRRCVGGADWRRFVPSIAVGVPLSRDIFDLNVFAGLSLPYVPYASIVVGAHVGRLQRVNDGLSGGTTTATQVSAVTSMALDVAPFIAVALNSDIIDALRSVPRAAQ